MSGDRLWVGRVASVSLSIDSDELPFKRLRVRVQTPRRGKHWHTSNSQDGAGRDVGCYVAKLRVALPAHVVTIRKITCSTPANG